MNNTKKTTLTAIATILMAATLVVGTFATTTTTKIAFASSNNSGNTVTAQINGQSARESGFDGTQEQEASNVICTHPDDNASCVQEGAVSAAAAAQAPKTCEQCFTTILSDEQITALLRVVNQPSIPQLCAELAPESEDIFRGILASAGITSVTTQNDLIACLKEAGIVFGP